MTQASPAKRTRTRSRSPVKTNSVEYHHASHTDVVEVGSEPLIVDSVVEPGPSQQPVLVQKGI